jgi:hypothetical protein
LKWQQHIKHLYYTLWEEEPRQPEAVWLRAHRFLRFLLRLAWLTRLAGDLPESEFDVVAEGVSPG